MQNELPLSGIKVLELANVLAGPSVGMFLAELGAEVVKLENAPAGGDVTRTWKLPSESRETDISAYFSSVNWGKKSIALNIALPQGLHLLYQLVKQCDIVLVSYKPGDAEKLKTDYQTLAKHNPRIIYAQLTGYGPHNSRAGYDAIIQAEGGFTYMNGEAGQPPVKMPVALMDILAAHQMKEAILVALLHRQKTGQGQCIQVSLLQSAIASLANQATNWLVGNSIPQRMGSDHPNIAPYGTIYSSADGKEIVLAVGTDKQFSALCKVLEIPELALDERFAQNLSRVQNREALNQILIQRISQYDRNSLLAALEQNHVPAGGVLNMKEVFEQPEAEQMLSKGFLKSGTSISGVRNQAFHLSGFPNSGSLIPPPALAQDTEHILQDWLNLSKTEIAGLLSQGVAYGAKLSEK